jgi:hypothetical protein
MPERRYSRYKQGDVWVQLSMHQEALHIEVLAGTVYGNSVSLVRLIDEKGTPCRQEHRAVVLARSSDWYYYSLNCTIRWKHGITCIVAGSHDSCIDRPVLALDSGRWYEPKKMRNDFGKLQPTLDATGKPIADAFEEVRKTQYGHNMLIGALLQRREDALARLATFKDSTRFRIEAEVRQLERRRVGRPLEIWPVERGSSGSNERVKR